MTMAIVERHKMEQLLREAYARGLDRIKDRQRSAERSTTREETRLRREAHRLEGRARDIQNARERGAQAAAQRARGALEATLTRARTALWSGTATAKLVTATMRKLETA